jgi:response regulator of citrate/malate metabolism
MCRLLIIDDDPSWEYIIQQLVGTFSVWKTTIEEGLIVYKDFKPDITIVNVDRTEGLELLHRLSTLGANRRPNRLNALINVYDVAAANTAVKAGASDVHTKPICLAVFAQRIADAAASIRMAKKLDLQDSLLDNIAALDKEELQEQLTALKRRTTRSVDQIYAERGVL